MFSENLVFNKCLTHNGYSTSSTLSWNYGDYICDIAWTLRSIPRYFCLVFNYTMLVSSVFNISFFAFNQDVNCFKITLTTVINLFRFEKGVTDLDTFTGKLVIQIINSNRFKMEPSEIPNLLVINCERWLVMLRS